MMLAFVILDLALLYATPEEHRCKHWWNGAPGTGTYAFAKAVLSLLSRK